MTYSKALKRINVWTSASEYWPSSTSPLLRLRMRMRVRKKAPVETPKQINVFFLCWRLQARSRRWFSSERLKVACRSGGKPPWGFIGGGGGAFAGGGNRTGATRPGTYPGDLWWLAWGGATKTGRRLGPSLVGMVYVSATWRKKIK